MILCLTMKCWGQITFADFEIGEVTCPTKYFEDASSINFSRSMKYGIGVLRVSVTYRLQKWGLGKFKIYNFKERKAKK